MDLCGKRKFLESTLPQVVKTGHGWALVCQPESEITEVKQCCTVKTEVCRSYRKYAQCNLSGMNVIP